MAHQKRDEMKDYLFRAILSLPGGEVTSIAFYDIGYLANVAQLHKRPVVGDARRMVIVVAHIAIVGILRR